MLLVRTALREIYWIKLELQAQPVQLIHRLAAGTAYMRTCSIRCSHGMVAYLERADAGRHAS